LLNLIAALPQQLLNKNSSELSLLLFATAPFAALKKNLGLVLQTKDLFGKT